MPLSPVSHGSPPGAMEVGQGAGQFQQLCLHFGVVFGFFLCVNKSCHDRPAGMLAACTTCALGSKSVHVSLIQLATI